MGCDPKMGGGLQCWKNTYFGYKWLQVNNYLLVYSVYYTPYGSYGYDEAADDPKKGWGAPGHYAAGGVNFMKIVNILLMEMEFLNQWDCYQVMFWLY